MDSSTLIGRMQAARYAARRGQTTKTQAFFILALLGAGEYLHREWKEFTWDSAPLMPCRGSV
jgi:hypothetical protein